MVSNLATYIHELLYEHDAVIIPNFGGFVTSYKPSAIDHVQGLIYPPSKTIIFNENLMVNDGVFINHIRRKLNLSAQDARKVTEDFVDQVKESIAKREIVVFPEVGRLYMDYEQKLQFLPDSTNYNTEVFGLPTVQYYPILRTREAGEYEAPLSTAKEIPNTSHYEVERSKKVNRWASFSSVIPYMIAGAVLLGGLGLYQQVTTKGHNSHIVEAIKLPNVNVKPKPAIQTEDNNLKIDEDDLDAEIEKELAAAARADKRAAAKAKKEAEKAVTKPSKKEVEDTEGATLGPNKQVGVIIVHAFSNKDYARRMVNKLVDLKYNPYTDKTKSLTRVGVKFVYESDAQLNSKLKKIRKTVSKSAYVKKK